MIRLLYLVLSVALVLGMTSSFASLTLRMGKAALGAYKHDQISYEAFSRALTSPAHK